MGILLDYVPLSLTETYLQTLQRFWFVTNESWYKHRRFSPLIYPHFTHNIIYNSWTKHHHMIANNYTATWNSNISTAIQMWTTSIAEFYVHKRSHYIYLLSPSQNFHRLFITQSDSKYQKGFSHQSLTFKSEKKLSEILKKTKHRTAHNPTEWNEINLHRFEA